MACPITIPHFLFLREMPPNNLFSTLRLQTMAKAGAKDEDYGGAADDAKVSAPKEKKSLQNAFLDWKRRQSAKAQVGAPLSHCTRLHSCPVVLKFPRAFISPNQVVLGATKLAVPKAQRYERMTVVTRPRQAMSQPRPNPQRHTWLRPIDQRLFEIF